MINTMIEAPDREQLEQKIEYKFKNIKLLKEALIHKSYANEHRIKKNYERLELLGDAFIQLIVTDYLLLKYPDWNEGQLTDKRKQIVCQSGLAAKARKLELNSYVLFGKGEAMIGTDRDKLLCDLTESVTGAIYSDSGYAAAKAFVERYILDELTDEFMDYKSHLQEVIQAQSGHLEYIIISDEGPEHDRTYEVAAVVNGQQVATGAGKTKKAAEQQAAEKALEVLK